MDEVSERIESARERAGLSRRELGRRAGLSAATVQAVVSRGARGARTETLEAIANALGVSLSWLLHGGDEPQPAPDATTRDDPPPDDARQAPPVGVPTRLGAFRGYAEAERAAIKQRPETPPWVWVIVADANPLSIGGAAPSPYMLAKLAEFIEQHAGAEAIADATARARRK